MMFFAYPEPPYILKKKKKRKWTYSYIDSTLSDNNKYVKLLKLSWKVWLTNYNTIQRGLIQGERLNRIIVK